MEILKCDRIHLKKWRPTLIRFIWKHGDQRITHQAIRWFRRLNNVEQEGTLVALAMEEKRLIGLTALSNYGLGEAFIVVHPRFRKSGVGEKLLQFTLQELPKVYTRVACDNIASLKLCFSCGLIAYKLISGPTGKPTLCLTNRMADHQPQSAMKYL
ncbi:Protein N-acetyltransferase, RimJ/RimL family [Seinonella peptonophila]|uniref:Protein N-acetyltransferase, RimJ/RimL family n=1 Tax=Seinonella peptonophila TaxID=112248 RepID=A0A1M4W4R8_9BACL|nr:GNAT family N-acetyltransferase [Seinonella peptonophila]SHE76294.1 Protein N-acetyltransferase, RimJ/RimL family [Seinonella peptonophila]